MKTLLCYALILGSALAMPVKKADVALLRPVEVIYIGGESDAVILKTDTDDVGIGTDVASALEDMKQTSPAVIYLDTAEYLIIGPGATEEAAALKGTLKASVQLCRTDGNPDLKQVAQYLPAHGKMPCFSQWDEGEKLPLLHLEDDRIKISEKDEKST